MATPATSEPAEPETVEPEPETKPAEAESETTEIDPVSEPESVELAPEAVDKVAVTSSGKSRNWTVISVIVGVSAAAAGIAVLKMTKVI